MRSRGWIDVNSAISIYKQSDQNSTANLSFDVYMDNRYPYPFHLKYKHKQYPNRY